MLCRKIQSVPKSYDNKEVQVVLLVDLSLPRPCWASQRSERRSFYLITMSDLRQWPGLLAPSKYGNGSNWVCMVAFRPLFGDKVPYVSMMQLLLGGSAAVSGGHTETLTSSQWITVHKTSLSWWLVCLFWERALSC